MIIGIGGPSNAGKSALAKQIAKSLSVKNVAVFCQDDYANKEETLPRVRGHVDWEHPDTIDFDRFFKDIIKAEKDNEAVIGEGFFLYARPEYNELFDKMIFLAIRKETFFCRKKEDLRWGREPEWYIEHVWERYMLYGQVPAGRDVLVLDGEETLQMDLILDFINK